MGDDIRDEWEERQRASLLPYDNPVGGRRARAPGPMVVFRWILAVVICAVVVGLVLSIL